MSESWRISLFGALSARRGEMVVDRFPTAKTAALLGLLALRPGHAYSREWLIEQLWPDSEPDATRMRLRTALAALRRLLEPPPVTAGSVIEATSDHILLQPSVGTDLRAFELALRETQRRIGAGARVCALESVLSLCTGELMPRHDEEAIREARFEHTFSRDAVIEELAGEYRRAGLVSESERLLARMAKSQWEGWDPVLALSQSEDASPSATPALPPNLNRFFGRTEELAWLREQLLPGGDVKLLTILGLGGTGKTRLALEAARRLSAAYKGNVWFIDASESRTWTELGLAIARGLSNQSEPGVDAWTEAATTLSKLQQSLLIVDNCEQLPAEEPRQLYQLLEAIPGLRVLATSRQLFGNSFGVNYELRPFEAPSAKPGLEELAENPATKMFIDRARRRKPDFGLSASNLSHMSTIVSRLEGIPLAIELAAAWANTFTPAQLAVQLENPLELLISDRRDTLPRHRSVRSTFEWSIGLLEPETREFFLDLSVFAGGWDFDLVSSVVGRSRSHFHLKALIDACLIRFNLSESGGRYSMLESLRQLAWSALDDTRRSELAANHLSAMREFAAMAGPKMIVTEESWIFERIHLEGDNLKLAVLSAAQHPKDAELALGIVSDLAHYWQTRCRFAEGIQLMRAALDLPGGYDQGRLTCRALVSLSILVRDGFDYDSALELAYRAVEFADTIDDRLTQFLSVNAVATILQLTGPDEEAQSWFERGLEMARESSDARVLAVALCNLAPYVISSGSYEQARGMLQEVRAIDLARGNEGGAVLVHLGNLALLEGDLESAASHFEQFLRVSLRNGYTGGWCLACRGLADVRSRQGRISEAIELLAMDELGRSGNEIRLGTADLDAIERLLARCRDAMGAERFQLQWDAECAAATEKLASMREEMAG